MDREVFQKVLTPMTPQHILFGIIWGEKANGKHVKDLARADFADVRIVRENTALEKIFFSLGRFLVKEKRSSKK
jgi:hypothetical protein